MIIDEYLQKNNISKYRFSKMCGLPYGTLNDICTGKTDILKCTGGTLLKIASIVGCKVDDLLNESLNSSYDLDKIKKAVTPIAEKYKLQGLYVFGSYARNEATDDSDIDILIDREGSDIHGIFGMSAIAQDLRNVLGKPVDVITLQSLRQKNTLDENYTFVENVTREMVKIYG